MKFEYYFQSLKDLMEIMKDKDFLLKIKNKNHNLILEQLDSIVVSPFILLVSKSICHMSVVRYNSWSAINNFIFTNDRQFDPIEMVQNCIIVKKEIFGGLHFDHTR